VIERTPKQRMLGGENYIADDPELAAASQRALGLVAEYNALPPDDRVSQRRILEELLGYVGDEVVIRAPLRVDYGEHLSVGARTFANFGLVVLDTNKVTIGPNVQLLTATHPLEPEPRRAKWESAHPITIGDNVWLGGGVIVCPGVAIGADTVVGAGAVVTRDLPSGVLAVGNPARVIRSLRP
jgi:maltose O-acetyltransferase